MTAQDDLRKSIDDRLAELASHGGNAFISNLVQIFIRTCPASIESAQVAVDRGDFSAVHQAMHNLQSGAGMLGATSIQDLAIRISELVKVQQTQLIPTLLRDLSNEFE